MPGRGLSGGYRAPVDLSFGADTLAVDISSTMRAQSAKPFQQNSVIDPLESGNDLLVSCVCSCMQTFVCFTQAASASTQ